LPTVLQIEDKVNEYNPYAHSPQDTYAHMNSGYWVEQIKATIAIAARLAVPVPGRNILYLPIVLKADRRQ
jgi:hypothetical protein